MNSGAIKNAIMSTPDPRNPYDICACAEVRKTARLLTQRYDAALRPAGLKVMQLCILSALAKVRGISMTRLADRLVLGRTGLTRNLKPLDRDGLIGIRPGKDSRKRIVHLTDRGREVLKQAVPLWQGVQHQIIDEIGETQIDILHSGLANLNHAAQI
jgi:DNA-binding MarR family transcriptional regulator